MKHLLTILCVLTSFTALAQFPNTHTQSNPYTKEVFNGSINPKKGLINGRYADTAAANLDYVAGEAGAQIVVGNTIYLRDNTATKWIVAGGDGVIASNITILNDSSISICNGITCDTFSFTNIVVNNFSVVNDSTILVCDGNNVCDTLFIPPTPISKNFVDSTKIRGGDSLFYYINGNEYLGGVISPKSNISIISDSSIEICSYNRCDTFTFDNIVINNFTILNDSTILVCDGSNVCDTLYVTPQPFDKPFVDSAKIVNNTLYYYVNGNPYSGGSILSDSTTQFQWSVIDSVNTVSSPSQGDIYLVSTSPTGIFVGHSNEIAQYDTTAGFTYSTANVGDLLYNAALQTVSKWTGTQWNRIVTNNYVHIFYKEDVIGQKTFFDTLTVSNKPLSVLYNVSGGARDFLSVSHNGYVFSKLSGDAYGSSLSLGGYATGLGELRLVGHYQDSIITSTYRPLFVDVYDFLDLRGDRGPETSDSAIRFRVGNNYAGIVHKNLQWSLNGYLSRNFYHNDTTTWKPLVIDAAGNVGQGSWVGVGSGGVGGNTKYLLQGYGIKIDSAGANYTIVVDTTLFKDSLYAGRGIAVDTVTYLNHKLLVVDSNYVRDTSLHLDGGTINQVLKKNSSTNGDWSWQDESGGGITGNYIDTTTAPTDSTIRFHFVQGDYVDYIIRAPQIDTSHLSDRIDANAANIATNTSAIAANTTAITANTTAIAGKENSLGNPSTDGYVLSSTTTGARSWVPQSAGGGGSGGSADSLKKLPVDTSANVTGNLLAFDATTHKWYLTTPPTSGGVVDTTGTLNTIHNNKGFLVADTTLGGNHNSPYLAMSGRNNGAKTFWATYVNGGTNKGIWNLGYSADSGATFTTLLSTFYNGTWSMTGTLAVSSYVTATQFASGTKFNVAGASGQMQIGSNVVNPRTTLILYDTTKGFIPNRGTTTAARRLTSNIYTAAITNGGTGYTNVTSTTRNFTAISGNAPDFTTAVTISGGALTVFNTATTLAYGARVGDTYTCTNCGAGSGMVVTVTALTGDTARGLQYYDSTLNQMLVWNGQAYSHEVDNISGSTYSLVHGPDYIFTGTTATLTLPSVSASHVGDGNTISIMNMGTGSITLNSDTGNTIVPTGTTTATNTMTIASGTTVKLFPTGTAFKVLYNN